MAEHRTPKTTLGRRRRANVDGGRQHRHEVKVTPEEEAVLLQRALEQQVTVPRLLVESAMADKETPAGRREALRQVFTMQRQLTGVATNLNQIAKRANEEGRTPVGTAAAIEEVRGAVRALDVELREAAGWLPALNLSDREAVVLDEALAEYIASREEAEGDDEERADLDVLDAVVAKLARLPPVAAVRGESAGDEPEGAR